MAGVLFAMGYVWARVKDVLWVLGYIWALPNTLVAALAALIGWAKPVGTRDGAVVCVAQPGGLWSLFFRKSKMIETTWGGVIFLCSDYWLDVEKLFKHALRHVWQSFILGPFMLPVYVLCSLWAWIRTGKAYADNALEADARRAEG